VIAGFIKIFQIGTLFYHLFTGYTAHLLISAIVFGIYVAVHFCGLSAAIKESPCGLKAFSLQQIVFVVLHIIGLIFLLWNHVVIYPQTPTDNLASNEPISLNKLEEGQDILSGTNNMTPKTTTDTANSGCIWQKYSPVIMLTLAIITTIIDAITAILSWKGHKQLVASQSAIETFTDLSQTPDSVVMTSMSTMPTVAPLGVVYIPANMYDPLQTYQ